VKSLGLAALTALLLMPAVLHAQRLYRYQDEAGNWVYTDRSPVETGNAAELLDYGAPTATAEVSILRRPVEGGIALVAENTYYGYVQIAFQLSAIENIVAVDGAPMRGNRILAPRSETELLRLVPVAPASTMRFELSHQHIPGRPGVEHMPDGPYRAPFATATSFLVSQAYPDAVTHTDLSSVHAIDFVMPVGTGVYAARAGTVIQIADEYFSAGLDPNTDLAKANIVRIVHEDGTMALYAHLNWNSIRVRPGQSVARGEYIADSGNTGFSSGPHLHFVVQRNIGGAIESVPVEFEGPGGVRVPVRSGGTLTAY
jgi:murein DD-endopeptidase MepM/ murein hydrolase activator NlpD